MEIVVRFSNNPWRSVVQRFSVLEIKCRLQFHKQQRRRSVYNDTRLDGGHLWSIARIRTDTYFSLIGSRLRCLCYFMNVFSWRTYTSKLGEYSDCRSSKMSTCERSGLQEVPGSASMQEDGLVVYVKYIRNLDRAVISRSYRTLLSRDHGYKCHFCESRYRRACSSAGKLVKFGDSVSSCPIIVIFIV